jgi:hypothetical protein
LPRKPTDTAHVNLRIREGLRRKLAVEAERHRVSLNSEMTMRLEASFDAAARRDIQAIAESIQAAWLKLQNAQNLVILGRSMADTALEYDMDANALKALKSLARGWREMDRALQLPERLKTDPDNRPSEESE